MVFTVLARRRVRGGEARGGGGTPLKGYFNTLIEVPSIIAECRACYENPGDITAWR